MWTDDPCEGHDDCPCESCTEERRLSMLSREELDAELREMGIDPRESLINLWTRLGCSESLTDQARQKCLERAAELLEKR